MATFYNQATLTYNGNVTNSNIVTGEIVEVLTAAKTATDDSYSVGDTVSYIISLVNTGAAAVTGVTVTDDLGAYDNGGTTLTPLTYNDGSVRLIVNGAVQAAPTVTAGPPLVISGITVPAGGSAVIVYEATVNEFADPTAAGTVNNTATVTANGITTPVTAEATITADSSPKLAITKSLSPDVVPENGELTYTFVITNTGTTAITATDNAIITDLFDPVLDITSVTFNGIAWTEPDNYTYDEASGQFTTNAGQITVPAAAFVRDDATGAWTIQPGTAVLRVTGTV